MKTISSFILLFFCCLPFQSQSQKIDTRVLLEDIQFLSSDQLKGRSVTSEGNKKAANYIKERFKYLDLGSQFPDYTQSFSLNGKLEHLGLGENIIGFVPGSASSKIILVLAHYDHLGTKGNDIYNGADDNASGTAALLNIAAFFKKNLPLHSLIFAATDAEEEGLLGAKALLKDFPFPLSQVQLVVNMDMISRSEENTLYAVGTRFYPQFKPYLEKCGKRSSIQLVLGNDGGKGELDWTNASDHGPFHMDGIPFIYFGVADHKDYHKPTDTFENIDQTFYMQACELILNSILEIDAAIE